jgi:hypothetical protein
MTVTVLDPVVSRGTPVRVRAVVHDTGTTPCAYQTTGPIVHGAPVGSTYMGPCGAMTLAVYRPARHEIWPGHVAYSCPLLLSTALPSGGSVTVLGQWDQELGPHSGLPPIPPTGRYTMVVGGRFRFTVRIR